MKDLFTQRAEIGRETLGVQTSVPLAGIINLGSGTPNFETPPHIIEAARTALEEGYTKYTPWLGYLDLREAICEKLARDNDLRFDPENEIMVTNGTQEALTVIFQAFLKKGDEVILPSPRYNEYVRWAAVSGAKLIEVPTSEEVNFIIDPKEIETKITDRTKIVALTTPNNPTGTVLPKKVLEEIAQIAIKHDLMVLSDELYEKYLFEGYKHYSIARVPNMAERTIVVNGFSKTYAMTGFRVGYIAAPASFVEGMLPIKHSISICAPAVSQRAALAALTGPQGWWDKVMEDCTRRRQIWMAALDEMGLSYGTPMGSYVFFVNVSSSLGVTGTEFSRRLLEEEQVRIGGGNGYGPGADDYIRGSLMVDDADLKEGLERMKRVVRKLRREWREREP
jgi:aminotransferase